MRVSGLLRKAQSLRGDHPHLRLLRPDELTGGPVEDIPDDERQRILAQIDEAVASNRISVTAETFDFKPLRRGSFLPVVVNVAAVVVVAAGIGLAFFLSRRTESQIVTAPVALLSAETKMVQALKEQSRQQLDDKDKEIASIRTRLAGADQERARIQQEADASVAQREKELESSMATALDAERRKLVASGMTEATVNKRIADLEAKSRADVDAQLAAFRAQADKDRADREKALAAIQTEYQKSLAQAQADRARLQQDSAKQQADLQAGFQQKQLALEKDKAAALAELDRLRQQQNQEQLVQDQILTYYQKARDAVQSGQPAAAQKVLADLRKYLGDPTLAALPGIARRRPVDLFLADSLEQLIQSQAAPSAATPIAPDLLASANLITTVASLVQQGDSLFQEQGYSRARELYLSALARIPAVQAGYAKLDAIQKIYADRQRKDVADLLDAANTAYRAGNFDAAVDRYGRALEQLQLDRGGVDTLIQELVDIGGQRKASQDAVALKGLQDGATSRSRSAAGVAALRSRLAAAAAPTQSDAGRDTLVALVATK
ncbi:MAG TPA: hypothetical protein VFH83_08335, partial [Spirochaetia bacterium]|nr:hypothetical protein [Spirochaetia bacterium]